jgi:hypothetical protein
MAMEDIKHVALRSPIGIYSYKVMHFGLKNAGATYQQAMTNIFKELHHEGDRAGTKVGESLESLDRLDYQGNRFAWAFVLFVHFA